MRPDEAMKQLRALGTAQNRKVYARHGVRGDQFGVSFANFRKLTQQIGTDQELADAKSYLVGTQVFRYETSEQLAAELLNLQRFGLGIVASPRHADVLLVTGPVTTRMREPLLMAYNAMPEPRLVAALGDCALGCGILGEPNELVGPVDAVLPVDLHIPGCPPTPEAIATALLELVDR